MDLINYSNGELELLTPSGEKNRFASPKAYQLILAARMNSIQRFQDYLRRLLAESPLLSQVLEKFSQLERSAQWTLKEKFARLETLSPDVTSAPESEVIEKEKVKLF